MRSPWSNLTINLALILFSVAAIVLLYSLATRQFTNRSNPEREQDNGLVGKLIQIEVQNACGVSGLAADATQFLRRKGFDVVVVGDYEIFNVEESIVIDRIGDLDSAKRVAAALGLPEDRVRQEIREDYYLDSSVIIGLDYAIMRPFKK